MGNEDIENQSQSLVDEAGTEPKDLAEAYAAIRKQNASMAPGAMEEGNSAEEQQQQQQQQQPAGASSDAERGELGQQQQQQQQQPSMSDTALGGQAGGGSADSVERGYYSSKGQQLTKNIHEAAARKAAQEMREAKIDKASFADITQKDEKTGEIRFINPDNNRPFESRQAAGAWITEYNKSVDEFFQQRAGELQRQALNNASNLLNLYAFEDRMEKMDDDTLEVFSDLIEPYAIFAKDGTFAGYRCNLEAAAKQAEAMTSKYKSRWNTQTASEQKPNVVRQPAVAMNTGGGNNGGDDEPKTLEEAMKMINEKKRGK